ncbi:MAG: hypothetical protein K6B52_08930 [Clostridiales bacterium]|nr:hypothetical protein [Clostridiales bacterium]
MKKVKPYDSIDDNDFELSEKTVIKSLFVSIFIITAALIGMTLSSLAMFSDSGVQVSQRLVASDFYVEMSVKDNSGNFFSAVDDLYPAGEYTFTVTACGEVVNRSGFFRVVISDNSTSIVRAYSPQMRTRSQASRGVLVSYPTEISFKVILNSDAKIIVSSSWATHLSEENDILINADGSTVLEFTTVESPGAPQGSLGSGRKAVLTVDGDSPYEEFTEQGAENIPQRRFGRARIVSSTKSADDMDEIPSEVDSDYSVIEKEREEEAAAPQDTEPETTTRYAYYVSSR